MARPTLAELGSKSDSLFQDDLLAMLLLGVGPDGVSLTNTPGNIRKTVATHGTPVALSATTLRVRRAVVCAISTNVGQVVVGGSGVIAAVGTRNSPPLNAGDTLELGLVDLSTVFIDSTSDGEGVTVYYEA